VTSRKLCQEGIASIERGQWERAETLLAEAVTACPVDSEARRHYAEALWNRGHRQKAIQQLEEAAKLAEEDPNVHVLLARRRLAIGEVELAQESAQHALDLDPNRPAAWAIRGHVQRAMGRPQEALADFHRALGLAPEDRTVQLEIARLHRQLNQPAKALAVLQNLANTWSPGEEPQEVLHLQGLAYAALGRYDEASSSFSAALARGQPTAEIFYQLADADLRAGRPVQAAGAAREALALDPHHGPSRQLLGHLGVAVQPDSSPRR